MKRLIIATTMLLFAVCASFAQTDTPVIVQRMLTKPAMVAPQTVAVSAADTNLLGTIELRRLDFSTPQKAKDTIVWLLTTILALLIGYSKSVQKWASEVKNMKGLRIAFALVPVVAIGLLFGFNGDWLKYLTDGVLAILTASGIAGSIVNPLKSSKPADFVRL